VRNIIQIGQAPEGWLATPKPALTRFNLHIISPIEDYWNGRRFSHMTGGGVKSSMPEMFE
jgi:hypothetical protein